VRARSDEAVVRGTAGMLSGSVVGALQACGIANAFATMLSACPTAGAFAAAGGAPRLAPLTAAPHAGLSDAGDGKA